MAHTRVTVVQRLLDRSATRTYLEIGVNTGRCFLRIKASKKFAVDPEFRISPRRKLRFLIKNPANLRNTYYEETSDAFFAGHQDLLRGSPPDEVFIDGLHTYEQSLRDVENALRFLRDDGVIVMHDCSPPHKAAAAPSLDDAAAMDLPGWNGEWCGDVWKTVVRLRSTRKDLKVHVIGDDMGLGIVRRGSAEAMLDLTEEQIDDLSYDDLDAHRREWLDLRPDE